MNAVLLVAVALGDQIERIGSYFGFAAVIGLGVLSLLYFAQAREVKRLREWAGRAPERDHELAQRVQDDAQKRVVAQPIPAAAAGGQPGAPQTAAAQQAEAARQAPAATAAQNPQAPGAPAKPPAAGPPGRLARPQAPASQPASDAPASGAPGLGPPAADAPEKPAPASPPVPPAPATAGAVAAARQAAQAGRSPAVSNGSSGQDTHESAAARPSPFPDLPSRAARKAPVAAPSEVDHDTPTRRRTGLIAGVGVAVLAIGVALVLVLSGGDDGAQPAENLIGDTPPASGQQEQQQPSSSEPTVDRRATNVFVLNGTITTGLAASVASTIEKDGFTILDKRDNDVQTLTTTSVYYRAGAEPAARIVARIVSVDADAVQAMDDDSQAKVPTETDVLVITGSDIAAEG